MTLHLILTNINNDDDIGCNIVKIYFIIIFNNNPFTWNAINFEYLEPNPTDTIILYFRSEREIAACVLTIIYLILNTLLNDISVTVYVVVIMYALFNFTNKIYLLINCLINHAYNTYSYVYTLLICTYII